LSSLQEAFSNLLELGKALTALLWQSRP
jgi:hypothetical protein